MDTFNKWLKRQINNDDPYGDLARDVKRDLRKKPVNTLPAWRTFLSNAHASEAALQTLEDAWKTYQLYVSTLV